MRSSLRKVGREDEEEDEDYRLARAVYDGAPRTRGRSLMVKDGVIRDLAKQSVQGLEPEPTMIGTPHLVPIEYAFPVDRTLENFAVVVTASAPGVFAVPVTFDLLVGGSPVLTVTATAPGLAPIAIGTVDVPAGAAVSLRAQTTAIALDIGASAVVGVS